MSKKIIKTGIEARDLLANGAKKLADGVAQTLGPYGQNFFLEKRKRPTNDGVSIAREYQLSNEIENMGMDAIREAAIKTVEEVGDGTTSAIVLANSIYQNLSRYLSKEGVMGKMKPSELKRKLMTEKDLIIQKLREMAEPIETEDQLINSARVSVEDPDMGEIIGKAQWQLGKNGYLLAEETAERISTVEIVKGIRIDNGFGTSQVINNHEKQTLEVEDTHVILTSYSIKDLADWKKVSKVVDMLAKTGVSNITVIARAWTDQTVNYCLQNITQGTVKIWPLSAPYVDMQERFKDLQAVLGGTFIDSESYSLDDMNVSDVGFAKKIIARRYDATIIGKDDEQSKARIDKRIDEITAKLKGSQSEFEKKQLNERMAQLVDGFGIVKVGSPSDMERKRLFDKCEDAVNAVRVAFQEGTVSGAGLAYLYISEELPEDSLLKRPLRSINEQIMSSAPNDFVIEDWVRDPVKVMTTVLEKAVIVASALIDAGGAICTEVPQGLNEMFQKQLNQSQSSE